MPANSALRRSVKRVLSPLAGRRTYRYLQAVSMARDIRSGAFTEPEVALVEPALRAGETAVDLGANFGMYLPEMANGVGPTGSVLAYEPIPFTVDTLRVIVRLLRLPGVTVVPKAAGERAGTLAFSVPLQSSGALS